MDKRNSLPQIACIYIHSIYSYICAHSLTTGFKIKTNAIRSKTHSSISYSPMGHIQLQKLQRPAPIWTQAIGLLSTMMTSILV